MEFSNVFKGDHALLCLPYIASWSTDRLVLRAADSLQVLYTRKFPHPIHHAAFSPSSDYLLVHAGPCVQIISTAEDVNMASIDVDGPEGCRAVHWLSETDIGVFSDFKLRLTIWSLAEPSPPGSSSRPKAIIQRLKCHPHAGWALHPDQRYFILAERHDHADCLGIYDAYDGWKLHFEAGTNDLANLSVSPCGFFVVVWDNILEPALHAFTMDGRRMTIFRPPAPTGLGIKTVAWHPQTKYLVIGDHASQIHVLSPLTWTKVFTFSPLQPSLSRTSVPLHRPPNTDWVTLTHSSAIVPFPTSSIQLSAFNSQHHHRTDPTKPLKAGVTTMDFSPTGAWLAVRDASFPKHVFLYCLSDSLSERKGLRTILQYDQAVEGLGWRPQGDEELEVLVVAYGVKALGLWFSSEGRAGRAEGFGVPSPSGFAVFKKRGLICWADSDFVAKTVAWSRQGEVVLVRGKEAWLSAYPLDASQS